PTEEATATEPDEGGIQQIPGEQPAETPIPTVTEVPTEEASPTQEPEAALGSLIVTLQDENGTPIGGACFELQQDDEVIGPVCDADDPFPDNGNTGFFDIPSGSYTLHESTVPDDTEAIADQEVEVPANDLDTIIVQVPAPPE